MTSNTLAFLAGEPPEPAPGSAGDGLAAEARRLPAACTDRQAQSALMTCSFCSLNAEGSWRLVWLGGRQVRRALERLLARQVVAALAGLRRGGLRGAVEPALGALLGTLHLASAIPALSVRAPRQPPTSSPCRALRV